MGTDHAHDIRLVPTKIFAIPTPPIMWLLGRCNLNERIKLFTATSVAIIDLWSGCCNFVWRNSSQGGVICNCCKKHLESWGNNMMKKKIVPTRALVYFFKTFLWIGQPGKWRQHLLPYYCKYVHVSRRDIHFCLHCIESALVLKIEPYWGNIWCNATSARKWFTIPIVLVSQKLWTIQ